MTFRNRLFAKLTLPIGAAILLAGSGFASAGDLNPPAGPVAPTHKTLTEVEPRTAINATNTPGDADSLFKITQPGSYYLTGNITGVVGKHGIEIAASGVTLDLNGFDLAGVPAMGAFDGVSATVGSLANIFVVNGSVRNWGGDGVDLGTGGATNCRVADLRARANAVSGISTGTDCTVSNCSAYQNTSHGINAGNGCTVSNCSVYQNGGHGILTGPGCTVSNCSARLNTGHGITTSTSCTFSNCSATNNTGSGIVASAGSTVSNCSATSNAGTGGGISVSDGSTVSNCSATSNVSIGISTAIGCTISNCSAYNNATGISAGDGCTVADCTARLNTLDGIVCNSQCVIRGNTCASNGNFGDGAGIHALLLGVDNRIEGNNCTGADRGIDVDDAGNFISRNTCSGNTTNWDVAAGNVCLVVQGVAGAAILGNTGGVAPGSTDPNANFTY